MGEQSDRGMFSSSVCLKATVGSHGTLRRRVPGFQPDEQELHAPYALLSCYLNHELYESESGCEEAFRRALDRVRGDSSSLRPLRSPEEQAEAEGGPVLPLTRIKGHNPKVA